MLCFTRDKALHFTIYACPYFLARTAIMFSSGEHDKHLGSTTRRINSQPTHNHPLIYKSKCSMGLLVSVTIFGLIPVNILNDFITTDSRNIYFISELDIRTFVKSTFFYSTILESFAAVSVM